MYGAWKPNPDASGRDRGHFLTMDRKVIVAATAEEIGHAFGTDAEAVELTTISVREWLGRYGHVPDGRPDPLVPPTRWQPLRAPDGAPWYAHLDGPCGPECQHAPDGGNHPVQGGEPSAP
jgi:hypothetical protein